MKQSRAMSLIEAIANVAIGFWIAVAVQALVFPLFGFHAAPAQHLALSAIFTSVSLIRSFVLRRVFEAIRHRGINFACSSCKTVVSAQPPRYHRYPRANREV